MRLAARLLVRAVTLGVILLSALASAQAALAQASPPTRQVTGHVTQAGGVPVPYAVVTALGAASPTRVDADGQFTIAVPAGAARLTVRAIGYAPREVWVAPDVAIVAVTLAPQPLKLGEIVITGEASSLAQRTATTAGATVNAENVTRAPSQSIEQALQGKVLGASINMNSGAPGGGGQIQIRGVTSILGNGQPLIVVD
ncbi:MAG TPA: carboxypeptidase regulatory-like domain-containing protein, partial [Gemmatimonadaceae bacterium]